MTTLGAICIVPFVLSWCGIAFAVLGYVCADESVAYIDPVNPARYIVVERGDTKQYRRLYARFALISAVLCVLFGAPVMAGSM